MLLSLLSEDVWRDVIDRVIDPMDLMSLRATCNDAARYIVPFVPPVYNSITHLCRKPIKPWSRHMYPDDRIAALRWMHARGKKSPYISSFAHAFTAAAANGHLNLVAWLYEHEYRCEQHDDYVKSATDLASRGGHLHVLEWMHLNGLTQGLSSSCSDPDNPPPMVVAAQNGHLHVVDWCVEWLYHRSNDSNDSNGRDKKLAVFALYAAVENGHTEVSERLRQFLFKDSEDSEDIYGVDNGTLFKQYRITLDMFVKAVQNGQVQLAERLRQLLMEFSGDIYGFDIGTVYKECKVTLYMFVTAVQNGHLHVLQWYTKYFMKPQIDGICFLMEVAVEHGHLHILKWLYEQTGGIECPLEETIEPRIFSAALYGQPSRHDHILGSHENSAVNLTCTANISHVAKLKRAADKALRNGHVHVVEWLNDVLEVPCTASPLEEAIRKGHLHVVLYLVDRGLVTLGSELCTTGKGNMMHLAAMNGQAHVLEWLHQRKQEGCRTIGDFDVGKCSVNSMARACGQGHLEVVQWLFRHIQADPMLYTHQAIRHGRLHVLDWLYRHTHASDWCLCNDFDMNSEMAYDGQMTVIDWLRRRNLFLTDSILLTNMTNAARNNRHHHVVEYLWNERLVSHSWLSRADEKEGAI